LRPWDKTSNRRMAARKKEKRAKERTYAADKTRWRMEERSTKGQYGKQGRLHLINSKRGIKRMAAVIPEKKDGSKIERDLKRRGKPAQLPSNG